MDEKKTGFISTGSLINTDILQVHTILQDQGGKPHLEINDTVYQSSKYSNAQTVDSTKDNTINIQSKSYELTYADSKKKKSLGKLMMEKNFEKNLSIMIMPGPIQSCTAEDTTSVSSRNTTINQIFLSLPINADHYFSK